MKLCIKNLPFDTTEIQLREHFEQVGTVTHVNLIFDKETQRPRGFGFVEMPDDHARDAISHLDGVELFGRALRVEQARERERTFQPRQNDRHSDRRDERPRNGNRW